MICIPRFALALCDLDIYLVYTVTDSHLVMNGPLVGATLLLQGLSSLTGQSD